MKSRAFSLIELLVVIAIMAILFAMMSLTAGPVLQTWKQLTCSRNLNTIWKAYTVRASDERMNTARQLAVTRWQMDLAPYVEDDGSVFFCPEQPNSGDSESGQQLQPRRLRVYSDPMGSSPSGPPLPPHWMSWDDLDVWTDGQRNSCAWIFSVVPEQSYRIKFEDSWQNNTWNDLVLQFTVQPNGDTEVKYISQATGAYHYWLCDADTNEYLMPTEYPSQWMGHGAAIAINTAISVGRVGGSSSYGMNSLNKGEESLSNNNRVILLMDYQKLLAKGPTDVKKDDWRGKDWLTESGDLRFARHEGQVNVLWSDGAVEFVDPETLDPYLGPDVERYWDPKSCR